MPNLRDQIEPDVRMLFADVGCPFDISRIEFLR
jgi:hypothetical protein